MFASYSQQPRGTLETGLTGVVPQRLPEHRWCQALSSVQEIQQRTRQTGPTGSLRDSSLVGMVDNPQENKHTAKTLQTVFRRWGDGRAVIGRLESKGPFLRRWDLKDNKQPALGRGRVKGSRLRERHLRRPRGRCMHGVLRPSKQAWAWRGA